MRDVSRYRGHARALLALGLPLVGSQLAQMLLHVADTILLGRYDVTALASMVMGSSYFFFFFVMGTGFGNAVIGMIATARAQGDQAQVRRDTRMALWLSGLYSVAVLPAFLFSEQILLALGQQQDLAAGAHMFLLIAGLGMAPALFAHVLRGFLSALERTQIVLWVNLGSLVVNATLAWMLIFGRLGMPELGVRGAAIATVSVQFATFLAFAIYAQRLPSLRDYRLFSRFWRPDWPTFAAVARLGLPVGLTSLAESGLFIAANVMMGWVGTIAVAAHGIALQITAIAFMVNLGLANAVTVRIGHFFGARDPRALSDAAWTGLVLSFAFSCVAVMLFLTLPGPIISLFTDMTKPEAPQILSLGVKLLTVAAVFQIFDGMQVLALGLLRGVHDTRAPMWIALFSYWLVGLPVSYLAGFGLGWGGIGVWSGLVVGLVVAAALLLRRFWQGPALREARASAL